ncbi:Nif3-like dinuclear metal center hexameric protein [Pasteuria penetrans]|uniref:Nif3-like dinuclear metal center hexameric protein n=1 Tax=Pasteuria penetrans TaxID=86005 RepID=UPI000FC11B6D|nr:Nif3-like dinuclear metal center hexameric protein [Pasteuria penetrans]
MKGKEEVEGKVFTHLLDTLVPPNYAEPKDPIGLQIGDPNAGVKGVILTLDLNEQTLQVARERGANWVLVHHAPLYRPSNSVTTNLPTGRLIRQCLTMEIQIFVLHTNLDVVPWGINEVLAQRLGLQSSTPLLSQGRPLHHKLVVYVPMEHLDTLKRSIFRAGAGHIGNYSQCSFFMEGEGSFFSEEGAQPAVGTVGRQEFVREARLETLVPMDVWPRVREAMLQAHPYEEVAYDLYPLKNVMDNVGMGRIGQLAQPSFLGDWAKEVGRAYEISHVRYVGNPRKRVQRVALLGGSGGKFWPEALRQGADVYLTGDLDHHTVLDAQAAGLCLVDPGHCVEGLGLSALEERLQKVFPQLPFYTLITPNPFQIALTPS